MLPLLLVLVFTLSLHSSINIVCCGVVHRACNGNSSAHACPRLKAAIDLVIRSM